MAARMVSNAFAPCIGEDIIVIIEGENSIIRRKVTHCDKIWDDLGVALRGGVARDLAAMVLAGSPAD